MRTVSENYTNSSKYYMNDTDLFSTETITVSIKIGRDCSIVSIVNNQKNIRLHTACHHCSIVVECYAPCVERQVMPSADPTHATKPDGFQQWAFHQLVCWVQFLLVFSHQKFFKWPLHTNRHDETRWYQTCLQQKNKNYQKLLLLSQK